MSSFSLSPLGDNEYDDGEVYRLDQTTELGRAIMHEQWLNMTTRHRSYWLSVINSGRCRFVGTVWSSVRRQVELTLIFNDSTFLGGSTVFCITLSNPSRFEIPAES